MANTAINLTSSTTLTQVPGALKVTITTQNTALKVTVGPVACKITIQPKTTACSIVWDESIAHDGAVTVTDHFEVPAASAVSFICGGDGRAGPRNAAQYFSLASATNSQVVWMGVERLG